MQQATHYDISIIYEIDIFASKEARPSTSKQQGYENVDDVESSNISELMKTRNEWQKWLKAIKHIVNEHACHATSMK